MDHFYQRDPSDDRCMDGKLLVGVRSYASIASAHDEY